MSLRCKLSARSWWADAAGAAAVEFALVLPLLALIYLGGFEASQAVAANRKVSDTTVELANITSQYATMSAADVSNVLNASAQIMTPYTTTSLKIVLSEVTTDANGVASVTWSQTYQGTARATGSAVALPAGLGTPNTSFVMVETSYTYVPTVGAAFFGSVPMSDRIFILPRQSSNIPYTG